MITRQEVIQYCLTFPEVFEDYPFHDEKWTCMRIRTRGVFLRGYMSAKAISG